MRILITGKNGQLGKSLHKLVSEKKYDNEFIFVGREELDLSSESNIGHYFDSNDKFDIIINCAAYTAVDKAEEEVELANQVNHLAVEQLAEIVKKQQARLIHISTDYVFDGKSDEPYNETDITSPINVYGETKLKGEQAVQKIMQTNAIIIRTSWLYSEFNNNFVDTILRLGEERDELNIVSDQIGSPTYATDLAGVILKIINNKVFKIKEQSTEIYHYSNEGEISWYDFAGEIIKRADINCKICSITLEQYITLANRPKHSIMTKNKLINTFDIKIMHWKNAFHTIRRNIKMLENSSILITGGTGSFGHTFIPMTLEKYNPKRLVIFSRDEMKQWEMAKLFKNDPRVRFMIGDVRDKDRLYRVLDGIDYVVHAAATKIVPTAEYDPFECVKTNVLGAMNLIDACIDKGVKKIVALSTDKASSPSNLYGATKLTSDRLFVAGNSYTGGHNTEFSVVRYGNVMGSRGSVIPFFMSISNKGILPITDVRMTRFMISLEEGVKLVWKAFDDMKGGEIYVKKIPSMKVIDIALSVSSKATQDEVGIRPGEKLHEQMIGKEDALYTYEYKDYYKILPSINNWSKDPGRIGDGVLVPTDFEYSSDNNKEWMTVDTLRDWIKKNAEKIGSI
jgi:UDP-N-acetylglucosamine 4,6-dehydratase/5-epimerase